MLEIKIDRQGKAMQTRDKETLTDIERQVLKGDSKGRTNWVSKGIRAAQHQNRSNAILQDPGTLSRQERARP